MENVQTIERILKKEEFDEVCRSCLLRGPLAGIFELNYQETKFSEILNAVFCIQVSPEDGLPKNLCETCIGEVIRFYNFKKNFDISELILRSVYENNTNKLLNEPLEYDLEIKLEDFAPNNNCLEKNLIVENVAKDAAEDQIYELSSDSEDELDKRELSTGEDSLNSVVREIHEISSENEDGLKENLSTCDEFEIRIIQDEGEEVNTEGYINNFQTEISNIKKEEFRKDEYIVEELDGCDRPEVHRATSKAPEPVRKVFQCSCKKVFKLQSDYFEHRRKEKHLRPRNYPCKICNKYFTRHGLKQHMRRHTKEKPFECKLCMMRFSLSGNLRRHMMRHTGERPHVCEFCGKGFIQAPSLTTHKRIHTGEKPFLCTYCGKSYGSKLVYQVHLQRHGEGNNDKLDKSFNGKGYECKICHKVFSLKGVLSNHLVRHGEKKFLCSDCGKSFYSNAALRSHFKIHSGERPYSCNYCYRAFSQQGSLKTHILTHTGDKPHVCEICLKTFSQRPHLKTHLRTHSGERPYTCSFCNKTFPHSGTLTVHIRTHTGETPYMCDVCPRGFYDSSSLKRHRKKHSDEVSAPKTHE